jgi:hypothetical protein
MATFSSVTRTHVLQALAEYDARGDDDFLAVYGFSPSPHYPLVHEGRRYDSQAVLGVAHRFATGRLATPEEVEHSMPGAVAILRKRGFEVTEPVTAARTVVRPATRTPRAPRTAAPRSTATRATTREVPVAICPTCSMALPATGICDTCS